MDLLNKLTIKNLKLNKKRTIVTIIGIILSTALLTAVSSMFFSARASLIKFEISEKGNYHYSFFNVPKENIEDFKLNRKIEEISLVTNIGYAKLKGIKNEYKPYVYVKAYSKEALKNLSVNLIEGRLPNSSKEIVIPEHLKTNGKVTLKVGEKITLDIGTRITDGKELFQNNPYNPDIEEKILNKTTNTYKIVGIMKRPSTEIEPYPAPGYTMVTYLEETKEIPKADLYVRYTKKGEKDHYRTTANILGVDAEIYYKLNSGNHNFNTLKEISEAQEKVSNTKYDYNSNHYLITLETGITGASTLTALGTAAIIVIIIIITTSIFCIKNSFDISITEKIRQYGMLSSIGATKKQIKRNVYYEAIILGFIGIPLGIFCGILASYILIKISNIFISEMVTFRLIFKFSWLSIIFAIILSIITLLLSARKSAIKASKITPITAIRNSEEIKLKKKKKKNKLIKKIFGIGGEIAHKNLERSKKKYRTTVISVAFCVTVFIALSSFVTFAFKIVKTEYESLNYNISVSYSYSKKEELEKEINEVLNLDNLNDAAAVTNSRLNIKTDKYTKEYLNNHQHIKDELKISKEYSDDIEIVILDKESFTKYVKGLNLNPEEVKDKAIFQNRIYDYITASETTDTKKIQVDKFYFKEGEVISGTCYDTHIYDQETGFKYLSDFKVEIAKITEEIPIGMNENNSDTHLIISEEIAKDIIPSGNYQYIYIDSNDADITQEQIEKIFENTNVNILNNDKEVRMMNSFFTLISIFLYGFIAVIALIGITNIFNTITTNMNLRQREFAMLKSIGMTTKEFNRMIHLESIFYGTKALIFSIPLGTLISYGIYLILSDGELIIKYQLPYTAILLSTLAVFLLISIIMKYSINKINKQNTIETIRNENI